MFSSVSYQDKILTLSFKLSDVYAILFALEVFFGLHKNQDGPFSKPEGRGNAQFLINAGSSHTQTAQWLN